MWPGEGCWPAAAVRTLGVQRLAHNPTPIPTPTPWVHTWEWAQPTLRSFKTLNAWVRVNRSSCSPGTSSPVPRNKGCQSSSAM